MRSVIKISFLFESFQLCSKFLQIFGLYFSLAQGTLILLLHPLLDALVVEIVAYVAAQRCNQVRIFKAAQTDCALVLTFEFNAAIGDL